MPITAALTPPTHPTTRPCPSGGALVSIDTAVAENALARSAQAIDQVLMLATGNRFATSMLAACYLLVFLMPDWQTHVCCFNNRASVSG